MKSVLSFTARRVTFETHLPVHRILSRLDASLGRETSGLDRLTPVLKARSKEEFVHGIQKLRPPQGGELLYVDYRATWSARDEHSAATSIRSATTNG